MTTRNAWLGRWWNAINLYFGQIKRVDRRAVESGAKPALRVGYFEHPQVFLCSSSAASLAFRFWRAASFVVFTVSHCREVSFAGDARLFMASAHASLATSTAFCSFSRASQFINAC